MQMDQLEEENCHNPPFSSSSFELLNSSQHNSAAEDASMKQMLLAGPLQYEMRERQQGFQTQKQLDTQSDLSLVLDQEDH